MKGLFRFIVRKFRPVQLVIDYQPGKGWYVAMVEGYTKRIGPYHEKADLAIQLKSVLNNIENYGENHDSK
tara:strand:+ start:357 stop:566 length:210 start_codon:yes stop_codon:yes gene_type:complete